MTNPTILAAADTPKPEANPPVVAPTTQPEQGSPAQDKPEEKPTSGK
jgi:hypothetical protein